MHFVQNACVMASQSDCKQYVAWNISVMRIAMGITLRWIHLKKQRNTFMNISEQEWNGRQRALNEEHIPKWHHCTSEHIAVGDSLYKSSVKLDDFDMNIDRRKKPADKHHKNCVYAFDNVDFMNAWSMFWWFDHSLFLLILLYLTFFLCVSVFLLLPLLLFMWKNSGRVFVVTNIFNFMKWFLDERKEPKSS